MAEIADRHSVREADRAAQAAANVARDPQRCADRNQQRREHCGGEDKLGHVGVLGRLRGPVRHVLLDQSDVVIERRHCFGNGGLSIRPGELRGFDVTGPAGDLGRTRQRLDEPVGVRGDFVDWHAERRG